MSEDILFYSTDNLSKSILNTLKTNNLLSLFKLINIQSNTNILSKLLQLPIIQQKLLTTNNKINFPILILHQEKIILLDNDILDFIKSNIIQNNIILGYNDLEMNGYSDKYSFINTNVSPIHTYGLYNNNIILNTNKPKINNNNIDDYVNTIVKEHNQYYNIK